MFVLRPPSLSFLRSLERGRRRLTKETPKIDYYREDSLVTLLREKRQWDFCKAYINMHPRVTKYFTVTRCGGGLCMPTTITDVVSLTTETTATVTADTSTSK